MAMRPFAILGPISLLALLGACDPRGEKTDGDVERGEGEEAVAQAETEMVESKPTEPEPGAPERAAPKAVEPKADNDLARLIGEASKLSIQDGLQHGGSVDVSPSCPVKCVYIN